MYNISMDPLLWALQQAAGVKVDGKIILGFAWSDDLMLLIREDKLAQVLRALETASGRFRKKTQAKKVFVAPLCPKRKTPRR
jgi:hypothetical protein